MPTTIQGFEILTLPKDTSVESFPIFITIPAATTRTITFPTEFNGVAISAQVENMDSANAASYRVNSSTGTMINLPASNFRGFSGMNIISITVTTGAAGVCVVSGEMANNPRTKGSGVL